MYHWDWEGEKATIRCGERKGVRGGSSGAVRSCWRWVGIACQSLIPLEMNVDVVETEEEPSGKLAWKRPRRRSSQVIRGGARYERSWVREKGAD
jgi:hypothetical protein